MLRQVARVAGVAERVHDLEPLEHLLLAMLARLGRHARAQLLGELLHVDALEQLAHRRRPDLGLERRVALLARLHAEREVLVLVEQLVLLDFLLARVR